MFIKASEKNIKQFLENGCLEEYTRFKITILVFCKTAHMMEHGRLLYLSLKKIILNILNHFNFNNKPEQLCEEQRQHLGHRKCSPPKTLHIPFWKI